MRPSWPRSKLKLSPILASPYEHASVATPGRYLAVYCNGSSFTPGPSTIWELFTNVQVNIIITLHDMRHTCIYITLVLLFIFFFLYIFYFPGQAGCPPPALSNTYTTTEMVYMSITRPKTKRE